MLGRPTRRRHMRGQQFLDTPAMIRDASGHRRCGLATGMGQTRMRCAESIDRPNQIHSLLQRPARRETSRAACGRRDVAVCPTPRRAGRAIHHTACDVDDAPRGVALHHLCMQTLRHGRSRGRPWVPARLDHERSRASREYRSTSHRYTTTAGDGGHRRAPARSAAGSTSCRAAH